MFTWIIVTCVIIGAILAALIVYNIKKVMAVNKTFADYAKEHPQCVTDGVVRCYNCGSGVIFANRLGTKLSEVINSHVCEKCGKELYRSTTKIT